MTRYTQHRDGSAVFFVPGGWRAQTRFGRKSPVFPLRVDACAWLSGQGHSVEPVVERPEATEKEVRRG